jgi:stage V sporulation protein SpoVS
VGNFGDVTSTAAGVAGSLAGTITSQGVFTITAGGAGTSAIGSMESALTIK